MSHWPASLNFELDEGTNYVSQGVLVNAMTRYQHAGQAFRFRHRYTSYVPNRRVTYRNAVTLSPESPDDFDNIMRTCRIAGLQSPPSSFADPFKYVYHSSVPRVSAVTAFRNRRYGGWQHVFVPTDEIIKGPVYWYDLNSAYRWAACQGLPDMSTAHPIRSFALDSCSIYLVEADANVKPYWTRRGAYAATNEELIGVPSCALRFIRGVKFDATIDLTDAFTRVDQMFPFCYKRISRAFWGIWNATTGPEVLTWKSGPKSRELPNPIYNPVWAAFITSRIKLRFAPWQKYIVQVYVDAMHTRCEVPTDDQIGGWKLLGKFSSIWIRWPGYWGVERDIFRHTGVTLPNNREHAMIDSRPWKELLA